MSHILVKVWAYTLIENVEIMVANTLIRNSSLNCIIISSSMPAIQLYKDSTKLFLVVIFNQN